MRVGAGRKETEGKGKGEGRSGYRWGRPKNLKPPNRKCKKQNKTASL